MIAVCAIAIVAIVALLVQAYRYGQERERAQAEWTLERRELLERIQRPEVRPMPAAPMFEIPDATPDEWNLVGTIAPPPEAPE